MSGCKGLVGLGNRRKETGERFRTFSPSKGMNSWFVHPIVCVVCSQE